MPYDDIQPPDPQQVAPLPPPDQSPALQSIIQGAPINSNPVSQLPSVGGQQDNSPNPLQPSADESRTKQILMNGMEYFNQRLTALTQPQGAGTRFRQGFGGGMMKAAGLQTPPEQLEGAARAWQGTVGGTGQDILQNERLNQQLQLAHRQVSMYDPTTGQQYTGPADILSKFGPAALRASVSQQNNIRTNSTRTQLEQLKLAVSQGKVATWKPVQTPDGVVMKGFNPYGQPVEGAEVSDVVFPWLVQKTSNSVEYKQQEDGSYVALPKTTVTTPSLPAPKGAAPKAGAAAPAPRISNPSGGQAKVAAAIKAAPVLGADGQPLQGKAPDTIRAMGYMARTTLPHLDTVSSEIDQLDKAGLLGQFKGKMADYLTGKKGFDIPGATPAQQQLLAKFINDVKLTDSAMLRTHFGARGGQTMYDRFTDMLNAGESVNNLRGGLSSFKDFLSGYANIDKGGASPSAAPPAAAPQGKPVTVGGKIVGYTTDGKTMTPVGAR